MYEYVIKGGHLFQKGIQDLAVEGGRIAAIEPAITGTAEKTIDATGKTIFPGFLDVHTHTDKSLTSDRVLNTSGTLLEAIQHMDRYFETVHKNDILQRGIRMVEMSIRQGVSGIRSHITIQPSTGMRIWNASLELKKLFQEMITLQLVVFPGAVKRLEKGDDVFVRIEKILKTGADGLGGCPTLSEDHVVFTDTLFDLAKYYDVPLDLHVDESDDPDASALEYLAVKTIKEGMEGRVTAGHCTSLSAIPLQKAAEIIKKVKEAGLNIVTLPACNLYLMGRGDTVNRRRGTTRIREFLDAGVNISLASDNIRDPFRPYGNGNLLEEALLAAQVFQAGTREAFLETLPMITENPALTMGLDDYGLQEGAPADLVIIDAPDPYSALIDQSFKSVIMLKGKVVIERELTLTSYINPAVMGKK